MSLTPGQQIGPYRLVRRLGAGGMGEVFEAVHERIARQVAIKFLHAELTTSPEIAGRFLNEARAVNIVRHPGLVQISDFGQLPDGTAYIVMEYLAGESLAELLKRKGGKLTEQEVLYLGHQIAGALAAAHQKHIVHRDLKPANAMLVQDPSFPGGQRVKLLDFGIAKLGRENQSPVDNEVKTKSGVFMGSPIYMSPEQCTGAANVSPQSDVYSFGVMLYHMLAGEPPFAGDSAATVFGMHLFQPAPLLLDKLPQLSPKLAALIERMLRKPPHERPTMAEVVRALQSLLRARQVEGGSWMTFRRRLAIIIGTTLVGLVAVWVVLSTSGLTGRRPAAVRRCNSAGFCQEPLPGEIARVRSIIAFSATDVWACGDPGVVLHHDGNGWKVAETNLGHRVHELFGFSSSDLWIVGDNGTLAHYDGKSWTRTAGLGTAYFTSMWGARPDDLWVVGKVYEGQAAMLHYDGKRWQTRTSGTSQTLLTIFGLRADLIYAAGHQGTILRYDGKDWKAVTGVETTQKLNGLFGVSERDLWVVGHVGTALHYTGKGWSVVSTGTKRNLNSGWTSGNGEAWAAGDHGTLLRYDGRRFVPVDVSQTSDLDVITGFIGPSGRHLFIGADPATLLTFHD
jgi:tRNA A-37 threonylcarbamoyl transferase component Bud32